MTPGQKLVEFYEERQGRPASRVMLDLEKRQPSISYSQISVIVNEILEDAMKEELAEIVNKLEETIVELKQVKLHLASMSDEPVDEESTRDDS